MCVDPAADTTEPSRRVPLWRYRCAPSNYLCEGGKGQDEDDEEWMQEAVERIRHALSNLDFVDVLRENGRLAAGIYLEGARRSLLIALAAVAKNQVASSTGERHWPGLDPMLAEWLSD